jgi:hypothetical protein
MWRTRSLKLLVAAIAVAACASTPENVQRGPFDGAFAAHGDTAPLPFQVVDRTGLVHSVSIAPSDMITDGISGVPGREDALHVQWLGGMCDHRVRMLVEHAEDGLTVTLDTDRAGACRLAGIGRSLNLGFTTGVDPSTVSFSDVDAP